MSAVAATTNGVNATQADGSSSSSSSKDQADVVMSDAEQPISPHDVAHPSQLADVSADAKAHADALKEEGNKLFNANKFAAAREAYTKAIDLDPKNPVYYSNRAFCDLKLEEYGTAIMDADKAIELDKTFVKAYYRRGAAHMAMGKYKQARLDFKQVVRIKPSDKDAQNRLKECEKAVYAAEFAKAIEQEARAPASERYGPLVPDMAVDSSYSGPRYAKGKIDESFITQLIEHFTAQRKLPRRYVYEMLLDVLPIFKQMSTLIDIDVPARSKFTVCGDVHGQFYDVINLFKLNGMPSKENPYLFNGDFVDRGSFSLEVILLFIAFKLLFPDHFHMLRGNHETVNMNQVYGFQGEVASKVDSGCFELFTEVFNYIPLAARLQEKVFVVHGGLFSEDNVTLDDIRKVDRVQQPPESGLMCELLWSDPHPMRGRQPSKRGVGLQFGPDVTAAFLKHNNLKLIIRSHEVKEEGYEIEHNGQLITVFSAPNYCDQMGNKGAYITFNGDDMQPHCQSFTHVPHPPVRAMQYASPMMRM